RVSGPVPRANCETGRQMRHLLRVGASSRPNANGGPEGSPPPPIRVQLVSSGKHIQARIVQIMRWGETARGFLAERMREARELRFQPFALDRGFLRSGSRVMGGFRSWFSRPRFRVPTWLGIVALVILALAAIALLEAQTSIFQSTFLPILDTWLTW